MSDNRAEQVEALQTLLEFNSRLLKNMNIITKELSGQRLEDTDAFLADILKAMNWEIQVVNGTLSLINEGKERINKADFNEKISALSKAVAEKDDKKMADAFAEVIPVFELLGTVAQEVTAI